MTPDTEQGVRAALRDGDTAARLLFDDNPQAVWVFSPETLEFLAVNDAAVERYGYSREEFSRLTVADLCPPEDAESFTAEVRQCLPGAFAVSRWRHRRKDGALLHAEAVSHELRVGGRRARLVVITDVTEGASAQAQLRQAQKMGAVGQLAGSVAHDFNNLLTAIMTANELASIALPANDPAHADLEVIQRAARRATDLTRQLLTFSRKRPASAEVLDLNTLVAAPVPMLRRLLGPSVELVVSTTPGLWPVRADPGQVEQVVLNLAVNARDAMPHGGVLTISTENREVTPAHAERHPGLAVGEYTALVVRDTGVGMDEATLARVFEPFFTTKPPDRGTGLGLSTVYGIVRQWGGYVYGEASPGAGSTFTVLLPRVSGESPSLSPPLSAADELPGGTETVLLVEHEPAVRAATKRLLERRGYTVLDAGTDAAALALVETREQEQAKPVDVVVTEVAAPTRAALTLVEQLRRANPLLPAVIVSRGRDVATPVDQEAVPENAAILYKPLAPRALARRVREVLDHARRG